VNPVQPAVFDPSCVLLDIEAEDKAALIARLVKAVFEADAQRASAIPLDAAGVTAAVMERESVMPTGVGGGFAFPHARVDGLDTVAVAFARLRRPLDFGSPDGIPTSFVCLMILPLARPQIALTLMAAAARIASSRGERKILEREDDPVALARYLSQSLLDVDAPILARDLMRAPVFEVYEDMPLHEVAQALAQKDTHATSVVTRDGTIVGQITCEDLFRVGMPDFFTQLKSIAFIKEFDPFDDYFKFEQGACARDVMTQDYAALPESATLLEVVFELAVKRHPKVYVVRDGKRVGIIDPFIVLDRVVNI
jgi:PTS system nitrogen regulatory IIA component